MGKVIVKGGQSMRYEEESTRQRQADLQASLSAVTVPL